MKYFPTLSYLSLFFLLFLAGCKNDHDEPIELGPELLSCEYFNQNIPRTLIDYPNRPVDYRIACATEVQTELVIEAGVVIEFTPDAALIVKDSGSISAVGGPNAPVVFTGTAEEPGTWRHILVQSANENNELRYCSIKYGGGPASNGYRANVVLGIGARLSVDYCNISFSEAYGFSSPVQDARLIRFTNNDIGNCSVPVYTLATHSEQYNDTNDFRNNSNNYLEVGCAALFGPNDIASEKTWQTLNVPYRIVPTNQGSNNKIYLSDGEYWVIDPGTEIQLEANTFLEISGANSGLRALGLDVNKILFRSANASTGPWGGIRFANTNDPRNEIGFATLSNADGTALNAAIEQINQPSLSLHDIDFEDVDCAIYHPGSANPNLNSSNLTYTNVTSAFCN